MSKAGPQRKAAKDNVEQTDPSPTVESRCAELLAQLSHEMRTPLSSILGVTQMLLDTSLSDAQREFAETVAESAHALAAMADSIIDLSSSLKAPEAGLRTHRLELVGNDVGGSNRKCNGNGSVIAQVARESSPGADVMPASISTDAPMRAVSAAVNFTTRIPPDTARLVRILVAEDHLINQRVMLRMLARLGFSADAVCNGAEAVAALTRSPYDLVLMDCQMPELDGYEATRRIRKSGGRFQHTPIIAVTAHAMEGDREKCLASGMDDYVSKPVLVQTLARTLEKWIMPDAAAGSVYPLKAAPAAASHDAPAPAVQPEQPATPGKVADEPSAELGEAVDAKALETLRSMDAGDEGFMAKLIALFLADLTERIDGLRIAAEKRDGDTLKRIAHALKGSCGHFGAARLAALCRSIELIGAQQPVGDAREVLLELEAEAKRVRVALEAAGNVSPVKSAATEEFD